MTKLTQETNDVVGRLQYEADLNRTHPTPARQACVDGLVLIQSQSARIAELRGLLREARQHVRTMDGFIEARIDATLSLTKDSTSGQRAAEEYRRLKGGDDDNSDDFEAALARSQSTPDILRSDD